jgi:hypothetical protein
MVTKRETPPVEPTKENPNPKQPLPIPEDWNKGNKKK